MDTRSKIILISGPTASGKSDFAIKLAKKIDGEIINADSMQVYKQFKILTARPKNIDLKIIKHHLYGFQDIRKKFGSQCIVVAIDAKKNGDKWEIFTHGGRNNTGIDAIEFAKKIESSKISNCRFY